MAAKRERPAPAAGLKPGTVLKLLVASVRRADEEEEAAAANVGATTASDKKRKRAKVSQDAALLAAEYLRLFVVEAFVRAGKAATALGDGSSGRPATVDAMDIAAVLPQLLLDF